jgi:hypothetical protein
VGPSLPGWRVRNESEKKIFRDSDRVKFRNGSLPLAVENHDGASTGVGGDDPRIRHLARPARDGNPLGFLKSVIVPNGRVIQISAGNPNGNAND